MSARSPKALLRSERRQEPSRVVQLVGAKLKGQSHSPGIAFVFQVRALNTDAVFRPLIDMELEDVGSRIVPHNVEVELAANNLTEVDLRDENGFTFLFWPRDEIAKGIHDAATARRHDRFRFVA